MGIGRARQRILTATAISSGVVRTGDAYAMHPSATQLTLSWNFGTAGSLAVQFRGTDGFYYTFDTQAVVANTPDVVSYFGSWDVRCLFTPSAGPSTGFVDAGYSGYSNAG